MVPITVRHDRLRATRAAPVRRVAAGAGPAIARGGLLAVTSAALICGGAGADRTMQDTIFPAAFLAALVTGLTRSGPDLLLVALYAAFGLTVASQLDPTNRYSFINDLVFFSVVAVGAPVLAGTAIRRRGALIRGLREQSRGLRVQMGTAERSAGRSERLRLRQAIDARLSDRVAEIVVQATAAENVLRSDPDRARVALGQIEDAARAVLDDLRSVLGVLRVGDEDLALAPIASLTHLHRRGQDLTVETRGHRGDVEPAVDATAYRVAAAATAAAPGPSQVIIDYDPHRIAVEIIGGHLPAGQAESLGLRVRLFGGSCRAVDGSVQLWLPRRIPW